MYDYLGIGEKLDALISQDETQRLVSIGQICKALVLMGLGFTQRALYLVSSYFSDKPVDRLIGPGIDASMLNDSVLGRGLDTLYDSGTTELFAQLAPQICSRLGLDGRFGHMDITSFHLDGKYNSDDPPGEDSRVIHLTKGYSRDHRPDLNQVVLNLITENRAGIPLHMESLSGNSNDRSSFRQTIEQHIDGLNQTYELEYLIMDSAGYSEEIIGLLGEKQKWICRVPETLKRCRELVASPDPAWKPLQPGYRYVPHQVTYAGVRQRWLLIYSEAARTRELKTLKKAHLKKSEQEHKALDRLCRQAFGCEQDAINAYDRFAAKCKTLSLQRLPCHKKPCYPGVGRPAQDASPDHIEYYLQVQVACSIELYEHKARTKGRWVVATNELKTTKLSPYDLLSNYKGQIKVEKGFRFMKDPQFIAQSFFVQKPQRVEALLFIMTLCLCVYAAIEYRIRQQLIQHNQTVPNQLGKEVQNPTARWLFHLFQGIHLLHIQPTRQTLILNLKPLHHRMLELLGTPFLQYYQSSA